MTQSFEQLQLLILNVGLAIHNADWNWKNVNSPFARLYYVTKGSARIILPTSTLDLKPKHLYFIPSFTAHSYECNSHFAHYYIHIYEDRQFSSIWNDWDFPCELPAGDLDLALIKRLCVINPAMQLPQSDPTSYDNRPTLIRNIARNKQRAFCDKMESRGIIYQLLSAFLRDAKAKAPTLDSRIQKALTYIKNNISSNINIEQIAETVCLSKDHFIRAFKHEIGTTPLQYINQKKIEQAQLMLFTDNVSIKSIAYMLGFEDPSYFNRLFKKATGSTPLDYRNNFKTGHHIQQT